MAIISIKKMVRIFKDWSLNNSFLNDFGYGNVADLGNSRQINYPLMWVQHQPSSIAVSTNRTQIPSHTFSFLFLDRINLQENYRDENGNQSDNRDDIMSDTHQIIQDFVNDCMVSFNQIGITIADTVINLQPIEDEFPDKVQGWSADITFRLAFFNCVTPTIVIPSDCQPAKILNSAGTVIVEAPSGIITTLDDIQVTVGGGAVLSRPAGVDLNLGDYYYVGFPTGTRQPNFTVVNPNTQVLWLEPTPVNGLALSLGKIECIPLVGFPDIAYRSSYFSIPTIGDFSLEGRPRKGTNVLGTTGYETTFGFGNRFLNNQNLGAYDFAFYSYQNSPTSTLIQVRENGANVFTVSSNTIEPMLRIDRVGIQVRFYVNNTLVWTSYYPSSDPLSRGTAMGGALQSFVGNYTEDIKVTFL